MTEKHQQSGGTGNQDQRDRSDPGAASRPPKRAKLTPQFILPFSHPSDGINFSEREQLQLLYSSLPVIFFVVGRDLKIVILRGKGLEALPPERRSLIGKSFFDLYANDENSRRMVAHALEGTTVSWIGPVGERQFETTLSPIQGKGEVPAGVMGIGFETGEQRLTGKDGSEKSAADSTILADGAAPSDDLTSVRSQSFAKASHELRAPLNSIVGFANLLLNSNEMDISEQERFYLQRVLGNANHLLGVVDDMLDLSVIESGKFKVNISEIDLNQFIGETLDDLEGLEKAVKVVFRVEIPKGTRAIETDRQKLRQVLINLLSNAAKFTHQGSITVRVHNDEFLRPVRIDVADTGEGIPEEKLEKIFEAFERGTTGSALKSKERGLGLTISRALCTAMGYRLSLLSVLGKGSTFTIELAPAPIAPSI